jgi:lipoprotein-releasing system ATP-binding protein
LKAFIEVDGLAKSYRLGGKTIEVLKNVQFSVRSEEMVAVLGPSGAGKSTLLHILGTLDNPDAGKLLIDGRDMSRLSPDALASFRNKTIGFVFQFHHLLPEFTALENTMMPALVQRTRRRQAASMAHEILEQVGLGNRLDHRPVELSGGEQQRVALARALVLKPRLLLADEPTGNLDEQTGEGIHKLLFDLNRRLGMTTVIVTHNPKLAAMLNRSLRLLEGRVIEHPSKGVES